MSIALLHVERCSAKVATPSETVNDKEPIVCPPHAASQISLPLIMPPNYPRPQAGGPGNARERIVWGANRSAGRPGRPARGPLRCTWSLDPARFAANIALPLETQ